MAKPGKKSDAAKGMLHGVWNTSGWALCIGAGTSAPVFPSWSQLVTTLIEEHNSDRSVAERIASALSAQFSADALIQAAFNRTGERSELFALRLSEKLYAGLRSSLSSKQWDAVSQVLGRPGKKGISRKTWRTFLAAFRETLPETTALELARTVVDFLDTEKAPSAVLSFNAEPLLFALINALTWERAVGEDKGPPKAGDDRQFLDLVTRSISNRRSTRIPYICCHGLLPVPSKKSIPLMTSIDKLVFSEGEYLQLANSAFSWQASAFLDVCGSRRVVFVGVSLSDPNMRRWLSWQQENRLREMTAIGRPPKNSTTHVWLRTEPSSPEEKGWIEAAVAHLGVRVVWMHGWSETGDVIRAILDSQHGPG